MWSIQDKIFGEEQKLFINALKKTNTKYQIVKDKWVPHTEYSRGSVEFIIRKSPRLININSYTYSYYTSFCENLILNRDYIILPWWMIKQSKDIIFKAFDTEKFFIRPNSGRKIFTGNYITRKWFEKDLDCIKRLPDSCIKPNDLIIISSFKEILSEYRVALRYGEIIDYSCYSGINSIDYQEIKKFIKSFYYYPDIFYVIDIAVGKFGIKILEINNLFSAGWYDMDYEKILKHIEN